MANIRYNISPCSADEAQGFISRIGKEYYLRSAVMADEKSHYDRYSYIRSESRVAVVYDTRAEVISITAPEAYSEELLNVFGTDGKTVKRSTVPAQNASGNAAADRHISIPPEQKRRVNSGFNRSISVDTDNGTRAKLFVESGAHKNPAVATARPVAKAVAAPVRNGDGTNVIGKRIYTEVSAERSGDPQMTIRPVKRNIAASASGDQAQKPSASVGAAMKKRRAVISFGDEDEDKSSGNTLARAGTGLYAEIAAKTSGAKHTAVASPDPENAGSNGSAKKEAAKPSGAKKSAKPDNNAQLKRWLPTAYEFLPEQARNDFANGIHDFYQAKLQPKDYSGTLMLPYRGLEGFVVGLQHAKGIKVKMIGQAFDKDDNGNYILKRCYTQRINSVIYDEVMVALYSEYFKMRNFIVHTDNDDGGVSRSISDRAVAKSIFDNILRVVEYNAKKLKEIGFEAIGE